MNITTSRKYSLSPMLSVHKNSYVNKSANSDCGCPPVKEDLEYQSVRQVIIEDNQIIYEEPEETMSPERLQS